MAKHEGQSTEDHVSDIQALRGKDVVAAIDFHRTRIYPVSTAHDPGAEQVLDVDPEGHSHEIAHKAGNPNGTYEAGNPDYWREISEALKPSGAILLLGHGKGKANASHLWVAYAEKHAPDVAAKVVADVRADIDDLRGADVLRLARHYFDLPDAIRYQGRDPGTPAPTAESLPRPGSHWSDAS
jgi:hypothetical protein